MKTKTGVIRAFASATALAAATAGAHAVPVTFNFSGNNDRNVVGPQSFSANGQTYSYSEAWEQTQTTPDGDITLRVTPSAYTAGAAGTGGSAMVGGAIFTGQTLASNGRDPNANLTQSPDGLGVMNNGTAATDNAPYDVDGSSGGIFGTGWFDYLVLDFDRPVTLDYATFSRFTQDDSFRLIFDLDGEGDIGGSGDFITDALANTVARRGGTGVYTPGDDLTFTRFGLAAVNEDAAWRLEELGVSFVPDDTEPGPQTPPLAPVPLPAAGWMLLAALGGLGAVTRVTRRD